MLIASAGTWRNEYSEYEQKNSSYINIRIYVHKQYLHKNFVPERSERLLDAQKEVTKKLLPCFSRDIMKT